MKLFCDLNKKTIVITDKQQKALNEMIAYHGSKANFEEFNIAYIGSGTGAQEFGEGIYLTFDKETAYSYGGTVYTVEIPDINDGNYIYYDRPVSGEIFPSIVDGIIADLKYQYPDEYETEESIKEIRNELYEILNPSEGRYLMYNIHRYVDDPVVIPKILKRAGVTGFIYNNGKVTNVVMFSSKDVKILNKEYIEENKHYNEDYFNPSELLSESKTYYANMDEKLIVKDGRTAIKTTPTQLEDKIKEIWKLNKEDEYTKLKYALHQLMAYPKGKKGLEQYAKDISKIKFDGENFEIIGDIRTNNNGISYIIAESGGDWEIPLLVFIYFDGKHIRGYIPTYGNCFDRDKKTAFGNGDDLDYEFIKNEFKDEKASPYDIKNHLKFNIDACIKDFNKHIKVTKGKLKESRNIIKECTFRDLLIEAATIQDIYSKYYSNIPEDEFQQIIQSDPTWREDKPDKMGKYGKWLLNLYKQNKLKNEDLYKAKDYLSYFVKYYNKVSEKDINKISDLPSLYNIIQQFKEASDNGEEIATSKSDEVRKIKKDAEKFYEDDTWLVVIPHTQEASCYYGKNTQWCTAATDSYNMFHQYYKDGLLYININKKTNHKYQFHFEDAQFMDERYQFINTPIAKSIGLTSGLLQAYISKYGGRAAIALTCTVDWDADEPIEGDDPFYVYVDYDGYYHIVQVNGINVMPCKGLTTDSLTYDNDVKYLGNGIFYYHDYEENEYYDEETDEYYSDGEYSVSDDWIMFDAKTQKHINLSENVGSITPINDSYFQYRENNIYNVLSFYNMQKCFETKELVQSTKYFMESYRYQNPNRKFTQYDDDLIVLRSYTKDGSQNKIYNIYEQKYIIPPFKDWYVNIELDENGYEYIAFREYSPGNGHSNYCLLLSDGTLSQVYDKINK